MKKLFALALLSGAVMLTSCVSKKKYVELEDQYNSTRSTLTKTQLEKEEIEAKYAKIEERVASYNAKINSLTQENVDLENSSLRNYGNVVLSKNDKEQMKAALDKVDQNELANAQTLQDTMNLIVSYNLKKNLDSNLVAEGEEDDIEIDIDETVVMITISDKLLFKSFPRQRNSNNRNIEIVELKGVSDLAGDSTAESADEEDAPQSDESAAAEDEANSSAAEERAEEPDTDDALAINNADEARQSGRWSSESGPAIPAKVFSMQIVGDKVLAICRSGLYELDMEKLELIGQTEKSLFGFQLPFAKTTAFNKISPPDLFLSENATVAVVAGESSIVVFNSGAVDWLELQDDKFVSVANIRLEGDVTAPAQMAATADFVLIARQDLPIVVLDRQLKELKTDLELPDKGKVRQLEAIPNTNKFAAVTRSGDVWQMDTASMSFERIEQPFTNNCTSMRWIDENTVWLSHSPNVLGLVDLSEQKVLKELAPTPSTLESVFGWIINPIYIALPKPSSLSQTMQYVLTGEDTIALDQSSAVSAQVELDVWTPIIHNVLFVLSVLAVCCVYVARKEF